MFKFAYHTDFPERLTYHQEIIDMFQKKGCEIVSVEDADVILNVDSIHNTGIKKGKKLTIYWEIDDFMVLGQNKEFYKMADLVYINSRFYLPFYPAGTKIMQVAINPDKIKEDTSIKKDFDYVFVGSIEFLPCYEERTIILDHIMRSGANILITYGRKDNYTQLMSRGKIILNILPRVQGYACPNLRTFEAMAVGCLMINHDPVLADMGEVNKHYLPLERFGEVLDEEIAQIKKASREHVVNNHTFEHRVNKFMQDINERL